MPAYRIALIPLILIGALSTLACTSAASIEPTSNPTILDSEIAIVVSVSEVVSNESTLIFRRAPMSRYGAAIQVEYAWLGGRFTIFRDSDSGCVAEARVGLPLPESCKSFVP